MAERVHPTPRVKYEMSYVSNPLVHAVQATTIPEILRHWSETKPTENAFVFLSTNGDRETVTWRGLYETSVEYAKAFINLGVKEREVVAIAVPNCPKWLYVAFGAMLARAIPVGVFFKYKDGSDVVRLLKKIEICSTFVLDTDHDATAWSIFKSFLSAYVKDGTARSDVFPSLRYVLSTSGETSTTDILTVDGLLQNPQKGITLPLIEPQDIAVLFQTSGSTGNPKVVAHTHLNFARYANLGNMNAFLKEDDIFYNDISFNWSGGDPLYALSGKTRVLRSGLSEPPRDPGNFIMDALKKEQCTILLAFPPDLRQFMEAKLQKKTQDENIVRCIWTGAQPMSSELVHRFGKLSKMLLIGYSSTEIRIVLSKAVVNVDDYEDWNCGSVQEGVEVKIVNEAGDVVPVGTRGELYVRSPMMFTGYFNDPEKTRAVLPEDGWYKTDDIGFMTEDGQFFVEGRKSDMIVYGPSVVNPVDLESVIKGMPGVDDVAIVPIPDDMFFQGICACVVLNKKITITEAEIRRFYEDSLVDKTPTYAIKPTHYMLFESLPKTALSRKTNRRDLASAVIQRLKSG